MSEIPLRDGGVTLVDEADFLRVGHCTWKLDRYGYVWRSVRGAKQYLHRSIMDAPPKQIVDHINGDKLDNRRSNLRFATSAESGFNRVTPSGGITFTAGRWRAQIACRKTRFGLGSYQTREEALAARKAAEMILFGEFRRKEARARGAVGENT